MDKDNKDKMVTREDLVAMKEELISAMSELLNKTKSAQHPKWVKTKEALKILGVSPNTLAAMRNHRKLKFTRIGKILYYKEEDIMDMLERNKIESRDDGYGQPGNGLW